MATVTALEAKTRFGKLLQRVARGEEIVITRHEKPVAVDPQTDRIAANRFDDEYYGIYINGPFTLQGIRSSHFSSAVPVPVGP